MYRKTFDGMNCSIARALDQVGEWWSLLPAHRARMRAGHDRFDDFQRNPGIARNVLTARLTRLPMRAGQGISIVLPTEMRFPARRMYSRQLGDYLSQDLAAERSALP